MKESGSNVEIKSYVNNIKTAGNSDIIDITRDVQQRLSDSGFVTGFCNVFVVGSTCAVTTVEFEPGLVKDLKEVFDRVAPQARYYHHHERWGDDNGHAHVRASMLGPSLSIPFMDRKLYVGPWQQIVYIDFDTRPREREFVVQIVGR
jgi:secondary thiamine-phosphate synthase enzyme